MEIVYVDYRFIMIDVGSNRSNSGRGIFCNTVFKKLQQGRLNIPSQLFSGVPNDKCILYVFVGDKAFPPKADLLWPLPRYN